MLSIENTQLWIKAHCGWQVLPTTRHFSPFIRQERPSGHCADGTNSLLLRWIWDPRHVGTSPVFRGCLCLASPHRYSRPQEDTRLNQSLCADSLSHKQWKTLFVFLPIKIALSSWRSHFFAHKQAYLPIYTVVHKIHFATSVVFFFHPETFLKVTCNKCVRNSREQAGFFLVCLLCLFDPVPTQPTETEKLSHSLAQRKKLTLGNTHGCELWTTHNSGTSHALNILRGGGFYLFVCLAPQWMWCAACCLEACQRRWDCDCWVTVGRSIPI